ncbi:MAG: hypothetical protein D9V44_07870 [Actinobacteria bacterium]|nr:MAG: hypothetical protein D9V44_07870 [Actinomycetota bacterium]
MRRTLSLTLILAVVLVAGGIAGCKRTTAGPVPPGDAESSAATPSTAQTSTADATTSGAATGVADGSASATTTPAAGTTAKTMKVKLYFGYEDRVMAVIREVPYSQTVAKSAMLELLKGPSAEELKGLKLHNEIPKGTKVLGIVLDGHVARVDLSGEFDDGGGTLSMDTRLAQVVYTLTQYSTIESVEFYMEGKKVKVFGGEGIMLEGPQYPKDYYQRVPIDA